MSKRSYDQFLRDDTDLDAVHSVDGMDLDSTGFAGDIADDVAKRPKIAGVRGVLSMERMQELVAAATTEINAANIRLGLLMAQQMMRQ